MPATASSITLPSTKSTAAWATWRLSSRNCIRDVSVSYDVVEDFVKNRPMFSGLTVVNVICLITEICRELML